MLNKADRWTQVSSGAKAISDSISNLFWIAYIVDLLGNLESDTEIGVSETSLVIGAALSLFATLGAVYSQWVLNVEHQNDLMKENEEPLLFASDAIVPINQSLASHAQKLSLSKKQIVALSGTALKLSGETIAPLNFVWDLAIDNHFGRGAHIGANAGAIVFAALGSYADFRTYWQNLLDHNKKRLGLISHALKDECEVADVWTNAALIRESVASFISNFFWVGGLVDLFGRLSPDSPLELSYEGVGIGAAIALFNTIGSVYCHWLLNTQYQSSNEARIAGVLQGAAQSEKVSLTLAQKVALTGDWLGHIGETAGPLSFILDLTAKNKIALPVHIVLNLVFIAWSGVASFADVRTCWNNLLEHNEKCLKKVKNALLLGSAYEALAAEPSA